MENIEIKPVDMPMAPVNPEVIFIQTDEDAPEAA